MKISVHHALLGIALALLGCDRDAHGSPTSGSAEPNASTSTSAEAAPEIVAAEPEFAFGRVKLGTTVEHVFKVKNAGSAPLEIARAKGS